MFAGIHRQSRPVLARPIRVTYVVDPAGFGGAEIYVQQLLRLGAHRCAATLLIAAPGSPRLAAVAAELRTGVSVVAAVTKKRQVIRLFQLTRAISASCADIVHVNMTTATNNRYALAAAWLARVPVIATVHTPIPVGRRRHILMLRWLFSRPDAVIAVSEEVRLVVVRDLRVSAALVHVVPNGVEEAAVVQPLPASALRILAVGRLDVQKGFDVLIEATRRLVAGGVQVEVAIAGEGDQRALLERAAIGLPVRFLGFVADSTQLWSGTDVFVLPSRFEGLPFALLEAMMRALPCVASDVGDVAAALGPAGVIVPAGDWVRLADAIADLAADPAGRTDLGRAARDRALMNYTARPMVTRTLDLCDALVQSAAATAPAVVER